MTQNIWDVFIEPPLQPFENYLITSPSTMACSSIQVLDPYLPRAGAFAASALHTCFGNQFLPFLAGLHLLDEPSLEAVRAAERLEAELLRSARDCPKPVEPWGTMQRLQVIEPASVLGLY